MRPVPLEDYVSEIAACTTADQAFAVFRREVEAEGFQNVVFVRHMPSGEHEVPFIELPEDFPRVYLGENFFEGDPVLLSLKLRSRPFTWDEMMRDHDWSKQVRDVFGACGELGAKNGVTIPFHLPNGRCDYFSLSFRQKRAFNVRRLTIINMKAYATWQRFNELDIFRKAHVHLPSADAPRAQKGSQAECPHHETSVEITAEECHAIVTTMSHTSATRPALPNSMRRCRLSLARSWSTV